MRPITAGPIKVAIETANTTIAEAEAVRSGNSSQQSILLVWINVRNHAVHKQINHDKPNTCD